ncbi:MAG: response regulator [Candidatus Harrisonbacteria bacterium]|nr:response regulator [Candidatus Harrisonbacteria bacterium]
MAIKVLVIEDEEILAKILQDKFRNENFEVEIASDGEAAFSLAKNFSPDIIVLDLILPKKDGFEVLKELKNDSDLRKVPVVILSNLGQEEEIKRGFALGATDYLVKAQNPIKAVIEKVKNYLSKIKK